MKIVKKKLNKTVLKNAILSFIIGSIVGVIILSIINNSKEYEPTNINSLVKFEKPISADYTTLNTDTIYKKTFGKSGEYAISISIEDGYTSTLNSYGSLEKAKEKLNLSGDKSLDGYLFTHYLSSYLGGVAKNVGIPSTENIVEFDNGTWIHYSGFPLLKNGDTMETYITWANGIFYYVEVVYKNEIPKDAMETLKTMSIGNEKGNIPK